MQATADISTFDSFCQRLVKKYFYVLNIDPSFNVLDSGEGDYFMGRALNGAIKKMKEQNPQGFELLLDNFAPKRDEEKVKKTVRSKRPNRNTQKKPRTTKKSTKQNEE